MKDYSLLTEREKEVKNLIFKGFTDKEIADKLIVSTHTARAHASHVLQKLGFQSRREMLISEIEKLKAKTTNSNNNSNNNNNVMIADFTVSSS